MLGLIRELADFERLADAVIADEAVRAESLFGGMPAADVVIAEVDGETGRFAVLFHTFSTFLGRRGLYLEDLFGRPAHRERGIGRRLLQHLATRAVDRGCGRFEWTVLDWNAPATAFDRARGAARRGSRAGRYNGSNAGRYARCRNALIDARLVTLRNVPVPKVTATPQGTQPSRFAGLPDRSA